MSDLKKTLRSELNLKTITKTREQEKEEEVPDYEPDSILAAQVVSAIHEHFDSLEHNSQPVNWVDSYDDLELTADHCSKAVYVAPRNYENQGYLQNLGSMTPKLESKSSYVRVPDFIPGGMISGTNYNGYGQKNDVLPQNMTMEQARDGYSYYYLKFGRKYNGNISKEALMESYGYPNMRKYSGISG